MSGLRYLAYPAFQTREQLLDLLPRFVHAIWPARREVGQVWLLRAPGALADVDLNPLMQDLGAHMSADFDPRIAEEAADPLLREKFALTDIPPTLFTRPQTPKVDVVLQWVRDPAVSREQYSILHFGGLGTWVTDPYQDANETPNLLGVAQEVLGKTATEERLAETRAALDTLREQVDEGRGAVVGNGPTLSQALDSAVTLPDYDLVVICNAAVRNRALRDKLKPLVAVAADSVHFGGPSAHAGAFRADLLEFLQEDPRRLFFTVTGMALRLREQFPPEVGARCFGFDFTLSKNTVVLDLITAGAINPTESLLTMYLLPLAYTTGVASIDLYGFDGRPYSDTAFFWRHDRNTRYGESLMDRMKALHPAFFDRNYERYLQDHTNITATYLDALEQGGIEVRAVTPSYVPPIAQRFKGGLL